ncbi:ChrR family anti-sigma-E factor [Litorimonas sp. RW-G-Af-16]|uniref:ChrR family anti-sigma-E factor n=1 Tax=Litorimonas sp. RW-G-Af-16 TaxID=3241168 RepID=UPI00390C4E58
MTAKVKTSVRCVDESLTEYAIGALSPAKHIIIACQSEISDEVAERIAFQEDLAATLMVDVGGTPLSPLFMGEVLAKLPPRCANDKFEEPYDSMAPNALRHILGHGLRDIPWKSLVPGVAVHDLLGNRKYKEGDRLYLLRAKGGMQMPEHGHKGEEWTLILTGSYTVGDDTYMRGDLHIEDDTTEHSPYINEGEDCICLVMTQAPLKMKPFMAKLVQPIVGI